MVQGVVPVTIILIYPNNPKQVLSNPNTTAQEDDDEVANSPEAGLDEADPVTILS